MSGCLHIAIDQNKNQKAITSILSDGVTGVVSSIDNMESQGYPEELKLLNNPSRKRINEFSTGRYCAHQALKLHNLPDSPILIGANREPVWPKGAVGSITHCKDLAAAIVATSDQYSGLGLDIETIKKLRYDIGKHICTLHEKDWIKNHSQLSTDLSVILIFSIKESIYKCIYQTLQIRLGLKDCSVYVNTRGGTAHIKFHTNRDIDESNFITRFQITDDHVFSSTVCLSLIHKY